METLTEAPPADAGAATIIDPNENGQAPENAAAGEAGFAEKISGMAKQAFGKIRAKVASRGRGRPKNCEIHPGIPVTQCPCALGGGEAPGLSGGGQAADTEISREIVTEAVSAIVKAATTTADGFLSDAILRKTGDLDFAHRTLERCQPTEKELDSLGKLADICLRKYGVGTEYCPEIGLGAIALGISCRYALAFREISHIPNRREQKAAA